METSQRKWHLSGGLKGWEGVHLEDGRLEDTLRWDGGGIPLSLEMLAREMEER